MIDLLALEKLTALLTVIGIDVALAGDNAVIIGMAASGLPSHQRRRAILLGIVAAALLRIVFAIFTVKLLQIVGLMLAGGLLLLWVSWKLWREIQANRHPEHHAEGNAPRKTMRQAVVQIVLADVSMSLDNVLAVAGAARDHMEVLVIGLALSVALMGLAADMVARLLARYHWVAYVGLVLVVFVAVRMIWDGGELVLRSTAML